MICPHCGYEHGWNGDSFEDVEGKEGTFYKLPIDMQRKSPYDYGMQQKSLYACPNCKKTFID